MATVILAIESSCDETSASLISNGKVLNNVVASQSIHEKYGGVVPELASRAHQQQIIPVVAEALQQAGMTPADLDAIAFTRGPGLLGALLVGVSFAKGLALALDIPLIEVNHMQAHVLAHFIDEPHPEFPFLCLTVSGGHTQLVLVRGHLDMAVIGETLDDAAGEAFDKGAKILGLPYPGGPQIDKWARQGNINRFSFPDATTTGVNFSFSGIKTSLLYLVRDGLRSTPDFIQQNLADLCASYQHRIIRMLLSRLERAALDLQVSTVALAGGVAANSALRTEILALARKHNWNCLIPEFQYCTDNAGMIAIAGHYLFQEQRFAPLDIVPLARMPLA